MAKIIVTAYPGPYQKPERRLIETDNYSFAAGHGGGTILKTEKGGVFTVGESIEEIQKLINEAESEATNAKLDLILANQEKIIKALRIQ